uniref:Kinetochore associated 1 n=1 Tax=Gadus morhua TaxID=8049 RepID=A0A8C5C1G0_GADMO
MWSDVELLTNEDTNSYRFGHVSKEENGSGLYQVDTLVKISTADAQHKPYLYSSCGSNWSVVVADRTVILFDQTYQTILLHLDFETEVDAVDVCLEGQFLVVCERVGNLHLIYVPQKRILLTRVCMRALYMWTYNCCLLMLALSWTLIGLCCYQDVLSLWDLHFLVMIWFSPDDPIQDFLLSTGLKVLNVLSVTLSIYSLTEAEKFAITFELDLELVYKVKLDFVLEQLASASVGGYGQDVWSELVEGAKSNLTKIADEQYVVEYCLKAPWPTFQTAEKMLGHAAERFSSLHIQEAQARLATFCSLHGPQNFNGISWIEFLNSTDNMAEVQCQLREGDLKGAQLLWLRHEIAEKVDEAALEALLGAIPEDLPSGELCPWFRNVLVPFVRRVLPQGQKALARWLEQKARNLELTEKGAWPLNGLEMAELGLPSLWMWMQSDNDYGAEEVANLRSLVVNLRQLLDLHRKYKCRLSLSVFEKGSARSLAFFMLDKITAPEVIPQTVEKSVRPYALEQQIPLDQLLLHYIKDLLERCRSQTTSLFTNWESKAVAVLDCMTETDVSPQAISPLGSGGPHLTYSHRSRALLCLIHLADAGLLETHTQIPRAKTRYYLRCFIYVSQLEALNISYTIEAFLSSPKEGMVKGLWKNHSHEPQAVRLVADLCLEYQVYDPQLWKGLLQKLLAFSMISHLQKVLEAICAVPSLWQVSVFQMLVQQALTHVPPPVSSASVPLSPDQQATLCRTFVLLLKCPFLLNMDLIGIANRFAQFTLPAFALGTLLLIPCDLKKEKQIQGFLSACNPLAILEQVEELMTTGEMAGIPSQVTHPSQPPQCPLFL